MNEKQVVDLMQSSKSEAEWNANTTKVRDAFNGDYPDFWYMAILASGVASRTAALFGSTAAIKVVAINKRPLSLHGRPTSMPSLKEGEKVVGVYDQGLGEKEATCDSLEDMQSLYDSYARGMALTLKWVAVSNSTTSIEVK